MSTNTHVAPPGEFQRDPGAQDHSTVLAAYVSVLAIAVAYTGTALDPTDGVGWPIVVTGLAALGFSMVAFVRNGGPILTPSSIYFLTAALFVGLGAILLVRSQPEALAPAHLYAATAAHLTNLATWLIWLRVARARDLAHSPAPEPAGSSLRAVMVSGIGLVVLSAGVLVAFPVVDVLARSAAYVGAVMVSVAAISAPLRGLGVVRAVAILTAAAASLTYAAIFFAGGGRIVLAGLGLAVLVALNMTQPSVWHKRAIVLSIVPALVMGGVHRLEWRETMGPDFTAVDVLQEGQGIGSFFSPVQTFGELVEGDLKPSAPAFPRQYGQTIVAAALVWVPRQVWAEKPIGFGARLTEVLRPNQRAVGAVSGHSMAALAHGPWYADFWWFGLPMMAIAAGWLLARLDGWHHSLMSTPHWGTRLALERALLLTLVSGIAAYMWGGLFSFTSRYGFALVIGVFIRWLIGRPGRRRSSDSRPLEA